MDPQTGEILAMVQTPTYENNRMVRYIPAYYYNQLGTGSSTPPIELSRFPQNFLPVPHSNFPRLLVF